MARIAVLFHEHWRDRRDTPRWIALPLARQWRSMGHEVELVYGVERRVEADLLLPNVDLTVVPPDYVAFFDGFERVVNRRVVDISKRSFSRLGVRPGDGWRGPVIVKTDLNFGGIPETCVYGRSWRHKKLARWLFRPDPATGFHPQLPIDPHRYPVYASVDELPRGTLRNPRLHVERFLPEREGRYHCARFYAFGGTCELAVRNVSTEPIVKSSGLVAREEVPVPEELRALRRELGFDFGKFDYTVVDGEVQLLDVNRTPTFAQNPGSGERRARTTEALARGLLESFGLGSGPAHGSRRGASRTGTEG